MKKNSLLFILICISTLLTSQNLQYLTFEVSGADGIPLENPFTGSNITPQFSEVDLNNDGVLDLFVFDFDGNVVSTYINSGTQFVYSPEYAKHFPHFDYWAILKDFDGDGAMDIFSHSGDTGTELLTIYKGYFELDSLHFQEIPFYNNVGNAISYSDMDGNEFPLTIESTVYPVIDDIDGDGDLDILSIQSTGGYIEYYQNVSVENAWGLDSLHFVNPTPCYGGALESGLNPGLELAATSGECATLLLSQLNSLHGGYSLLTLDNDGNGTKDLLFGDASYFSMNMLTNTGTTTAAHITAQDTFFPSYSQSIDVFGIPTAFYFDVDFDGKKDLTVASRISNISTDGYSLLYKNSGTTEAPNFELAAEDWLMNWAIGYGKLSHPTFTDYNQDGLMDMVMGSQTIRQNPTETRAHLILFENIGTVTAPEFTVVDMDWLGLSSFDTYWLRPTFGDLDNDGDEDLLVGTLNGALIFLENNAGEGMPYTFETAIAEYMGIDGGANPLGQLTSPQIIDLDDDGQKDIVVGLRQGILVYFRNLGTDGNPNFNPDPNSGDNIFQLGAVFTGVNNSAIPFIIEVDDEKILYVGDGNGVVSTYGNIDNNLSGTFDIINENWLEGHGEFASPAFVDINKNGYLDLFLGNYRGGINAWSTDTYVGGEIVSNYNVEVNQAIQIYPNPATNVIDFEVEELVLQFTIYNALGQVVLKNKKDVSTLSTGMYLLEIQTADKTYVGKFNKL